MKLNPAVSLLAVLAIATISILWAITPKAAVTLPSTTLTSKKPTLNLKHSHSSQELTPAQKNRIATMAENWPASPSFDADFNALDPSYKVAAISNSLFNPSDDYWGLPRDNKGSFELVDAYCTACHSLSIVMQQRASPERWKELLVWMEEEQGMAKIPMEDEKLILEYIGTHFSTVSKN